MAGQPGAHPRHVCVKILTLLMHTLSHLREKLFIVGFLQTYIGALYFSSASIFVTQVEQNPDIFEA